MQGKSELQASSSDLASQPAPSRAAAISARSLLLAAALTLAAYASINVHYPTDDDWWTLYKMFSERGRFFELAFEPWTHHWHPLFFLGPALALGLDSEHYAIVPMRLLNAVGLFASVCALATAARALRLSKLSIAAGMVLFTFHQATVGVLRQWDSFGQLWGDAIVRWVFVAVLLRSLAKAPHWLQGIRGDVILTLACFIGVTGTERVLGTVLGAFAWFVPTAFYALVMTPGEGAEPTRAESARQTLHHILRPLVGLAAAILAFLILRSVIGAAADAGGRYTFGSPLEIARNVVQMSYALVTPFSTLKVFNWRTYGPQLYFWVSVAGTVLAFAALTSALVLGRRRKRPTLNAALAMVGACFPMALASHVSEHYLASASFFFVLLLAMALETVFADRGESSSGVWSRRAPELAVALYLALQVHGFTTKELAAAEAGERDVRDGRALFAQLRDLPTGTSIQIVRDPGVAKTYSCYSSRSGSTVLLVEAARAGKLWLSGGDDSPVVVRLKSDGRYLVNVRKPHASRGVPSSATADYGAP
jgi:hypothetical protein